MRNKSFTLIELLVVIVIIGILAGVIMISTSSSIEKANFAKAKAFSANIKDSMMLDLVSEWTFDEGSGIVNQTATASDVRDGWGNNHGTVNGDPKLKGKEDCVFGKCLEFDGNNDYLDCGNVSVSNITISVWINPNTWKSDATILRKQSSYLADINDSNEFRFYFYGLTDPVVSFPTLSYNLNTWIFLVGTYNEESLKLYVNGDLKNTDPSTGTIVVNQVSLFMGAENGSTDYFNGLIDDVRIYDAALSSAQIKQNYIAGLNSMLAKGVISELEYKERLSNLSMNK